MQITDNAFTVQAKHDIVIAFVHTEFGYYKGPTSKLIFCKKNPLPGVFKHSNVTNIDNNTFIVYCNTEFRRAIDNNHYYVVVVIPKGSILHCNMKDYGPVEVQSDIPMYRYDTSDDRFRYSKKFGYNKNANYENVLVTKRNTFTLFPNKQSSLLAKFNNKALFQEILEI